MSLQTLIPDLHCPYCGSALEPAWGDLQTCVESGYGILRCGCYRYPIIDGIVVLRQCSGPGDTYDVAVEHIAAGRPAQALEHALTKLSPGRRPRGSSVLQRVMRRLAAADKRSAPSSSSAPRKELTFREDLARFRTETYADYLFHRYANNSFLAAVPLLAFLSLQAQAMAGRARGGFRVLDLGCGIGHATLLMRTMLPHTGIVAADFDFTNLYLARRYLVPDVDCICMDAEAPLPFADRAFDAIFCLDAFHYLRSKVAIAREVQRIMTAQGVLALAHLHNAALANPTPGIPLHAADYQRCFGDMSTRLLRETDVLRDFVRDARLDLRTQPGPAELAQAPVFSLLATMRTDPWLEYSDLDAVLLGSQARRLAINPIYTVQLRDSRVHLRMTWPNPALEAECALVKEFLPAEAEIDEPLFRRAAAGTATAADQPRLRELLRSFILVHLPEGYA